MISRRRRGLLCLSQSPSIADDGRFRLEEGSYPHPPSSSRSSNYATGGMRYVYAELKGKEVEEEVEEGGGRTRRFDLVGRSGVSPGKKMMTTLDWRKARPRV
mmetsp:Transcript_21040/g.44416  ORF Transcript_21040/g.44416 Transcript_21040/m.44416 type:complete len:102 (-) Transcript_21040:225-530(-)